jgi:hypothetical protein
LNTSAKVSTEIAAYIGSIKLAAAEQTLQRQVVWTAFQASIKVQIMPLLPSPAAKLGRTPIRARSLPFAFVVEQACVQSHQNNCVCDCVKRVFNGGDTVRTDMVLIREMVSLIAFSISFP